MKDEIITVELPKDIYRHLERMHQTIISLSEDDDYYHIDVESSEDPRISAEELGIWVYFQVHHCHEEGGMERLANKFNISLEMVQDVITKLDDFGYMNRYL